MGNPTTTKSTRSKNSLVVHHKRIPVNAESFGVNSLFEFSRIVNTSEGLPFAMNHFLLTAMGKLFCTRSILFLKQDDGSYKTENVRGINPDILSKHFVIPKPPKVLIYLKATKIKNSRLINSLKNEKIDFIIPLIVKNNVLGFVGFGRITNKKLNPEESTYLKSLVNIAATAIEQKLNIDKLSITNRELDRRMHELNTLFDLGKEFNELFDRERIVKLFTLSLMGQIGTSQFAICIKEHNEMKLVSSRLKQSLDPAIIKIICNIKSPTMIPTRTIPKNISSQLLECGVKLLVPMILHDEVKGIIVLGKKMSGTEYTESDLEFLFSIGNLVVISLENSHLFAEAIEKQKMEDELIIAREIQKGLLPGKLPDIPRYDIAAVNISSKQVGGDYYDVIKLNNEKFIIAIADVSGKGTPASLLMANLQAMIRALVPIGLSLPELTKRVNDLIYESTGNDRFITFFWGALDTNSNTLNYVNAGHNPPILLRRDGKIERLEIGGLLIGVMKTVVPYKEGNIQLNTGDTLVLFTDGVSEAMDSQGVEYGEDKLFSVIKSNQNENACIILNRIVESVQEYSGAYQSDDITMVVVKFS
jgi:sigma-B regulation protein RsbU (phosphoserine phosphatase)